MSEPFEFYLLPRDLVVVDDDKRVIGIERSDRPDRAELTPASGMLEVVAAPDGNADVGTFLSLKVRTTGRVVSVQLTEGRDCKPDARPAAGCLRLIHRPLRVKRHDSKEHELAMTVSLQPGDWVTFSAPVPIGRVWVPGEPTPDRGEWRAVCKDFAPGKSFYEPGVLEVIGWLTDPASEDSPDAIALRTRKTSATRSKIYRLDLPVIGYLRLVHRPFDINKISHAVENLP